MNDYRQSKVFGHYCRYIKIKTKKKLLLKIIYVEDQNEESPFLEMLKGVFGLVISGSYPKSI